MVGVLFAGKDSRSFFFCFNDFTFQFLACFWETLRPLLKETQISKAYCSTNFSGRPLRIARIRGGKWYQPQPYTASPYRHSRLHFRFTMPTGANGFPQTCSRLFLFLINSIKADCVTYWWSLGSTRLFRRTYL